jgi:hypothetical protein
LANDLKIVGEAEKGCQTSADQFVIVHDQDGDGSA